MGSTSDLVENVDFGRNYDFGGRGDAFQRFEHHGTNVAGVIAARDNQVGVRGVAPRATIHGHNFLTLEEIHDRHLVEAMSRSRADTAVSNNSWGPRDGPGFGGSAPRFWELAVEAGVKEGHDGKGTFYAFAAGNGGDEGDDSNLDEFANFYAVTAVCAVGDEDVRVVYSEVGASLWVCAQSLDLPPEESRGIVTTDNSDTYYRYFNGTSASTPIVSGVAALLREVNPELTWRDLKLILAGSARKNDPGHSGWEDGSPKYASAHSASPYHFNHEYGFGMVDARAAVELAKEWKNLPPQLASEVTSSPNLGSHISDSFGSGPGSPVTESLTLNTPIRFTEFVELNLDFQHDSFRDLKIELVSPSGKVSRILAPFDTRTLDFPTYYPLDGRVRFGSAKHLGEDPNGVWTLRVQDHFGDREGIIRSWSLKVYGHGADCWQRVSNDRDETGHWDASKCSSFVRQGSSSRYYTFSLPESSTVSIRLESEADPYLYLRRGEARQGRHLHENDDYEGDRTVSLIEEPLRAGTYTIEATTYSADPSGSFSLTISGLGGERESVPGTDPSPGTGVGDVCMGTVSVDGAISGEWASGCQSQVIGRGFARYFTFTLEQQSQVTMDLESAIDTYLYLRRGSAIGRDFLHENDDVEPRVDTDSRIVATLAMGTYTVEATTYYPDQTGPFTLTISGLDIQSSNEPETGAGVTGHRGGSTVTRGGQQQREAEILLSSASGHSGSKVIVYGANFEPLTPLGTVKFGSVEVEPELTTTTDRDGKLSFEVEIPGSIEGTQAIEVTVGDMVAVSAITVSVPEVRPNDTLGVAHGLKILGPNLVVVWHFNNDTKTWTYNNGEEGSNLTQLVPGEIYLVRVKSPAMVMLNGDVRVLSCRGGNCWNSIAW